MVQRPLRAAPLGSGDSAPGIHAGQATSPPTLPPNPRPTSPTSPTATTPFPTNIASAPIDIPRLIINNCELISPGGPPITLATSRHENRWTVHATRGRHVFLSGEAAYLQGALDDLHSKSAEAVHQHLARPPPPGCLDDAPSDESGSDGEQLAPWGSRSEPYPCCGWDGTRPRTRTRLLPVSATRRRAPLSGFTPPPPPPPPASPPPPRLPASYVPPSLAPADASQSAPALLVISSPGAAPRRVLTRVDPSQRAIKQEALRLDRGACDGPGVPFARICGVGLQGSEVCEVGELGDDLSAVFKRGIPTVYVEMRARKAMSLWRVSKRDDGGEGDEI